MSFKKDRGPTKVTFNPAYEFAEAVQFSQHAKAAISRINTTLQTIE